MNHSEYLAVRGITKDSVLPLGRNIAINVDLFLYVNGAWPHGEVKINATASVAHRVTWRLSSVQSSCDLDYNARNGGYNASVLIN